MTAATARRACLTSAVLRNPCGVRHGDMRHPDRAPSGGTVSRAQSPGPDPRMVADQRTLQGDGGGGEVAAGSDPATGQLRRDSAWIRIACPPWNRTDAGSTMLASSSSTSGTAATPRTTQLCARADGSQSRWRRGGIQITILRQGWPQLPAAIRRPQTRPSPSRSMSQIRSMTRDALYAASRSVTPKASPTPTVGKRRARRSR